MKKMLIIGLFLIARPLFIFAQTTQDREKLTFYQDSLSHLGYAFINDEIDIDRKVLSDLAIHEPESFKAIVEQAKAALAKKAAA